MKNSPFIMRFLRNESGVALVEFAFAFPILIVLSYGVIELTRYILITQKVEKLAHSLADITAQSNSLTTADMNRIAEATAHVMDPYVTGSNSRVIVSSLYRTPGQASARVTWCYRGGGSLVSTSRIGALNAIPTMPTGSGFTFNERENVISAEVFYRFSPIVTSRFFGTRTIYRAAFYRPRLGALSAAPVSCS